MAVIGLAATAGAQVPNGGFEQWSTPDGASYLDPDGWITFNSLTDLAGADLSCAQGSPGAVGLHYATVTTRNTDFGLFPGMVMTGDPQSGASGFPYASRPGVLSGQWQYGIQSGDQGMVAAYFSKWNPVTQTSDSVGAGVALLEGSVSGWTSFSIPVQYFNANTPDTAYVVVISSMNEPVDGSFIKVDALGFGASTGVGELEDASVNLYPSPTMGLVHVSVTRPVELAEVMDLTGRQVLSQAVQAGKATLDLSALPAGRYLVRLRFADGQRQVRTVVKQ